MEETTKTAPLPRRRDLDALVYTAFMGHEPRVVPPEELAASDPWQAWAVLRPFAGPRWRHVRRFCNESLLSPQVRERLAPLLAQARKRWAEARARLTAHRAAAAVTRAHARAKSLRADLRLPGRAARQPHYSSS